MSVGIDRFGEWLGNYQWPPTDWSSFQTEVANKLSELNLNEKESISLTGARPEYYDSAEALVVGWFNDISRIFEITTRGSSDVIRENFHAIGSGGLYAKVIDRAFEVARLNKPTVERLHLNLQVVCQTAQNCEEPIHIWRVEPTGITKLHPTGASS